MPRHGSASNLQIGKIETNQPNNDHYKIDNGWASGADKFENRQDASFTCLLTSSSRINERALSVATRRATREPFV